MHSEVQANEGGKKEMVYLIMHSTFCLWLFGHMVKDDLERKLTVTTTWVTLFN